MKHDEWEISELERAAYRLTANLLRIMAGAGRIVDLKRELNELTTLANQIGDKRGWSCVDSSVHEALQLHWSDYDEERQKRNIVENALRIAAGKLLGQTPPPFMGLYALEESVERYNDARQRRIEAERLSDSKLKGRKRQKAKAL